MKRLFYLLFSFAVMRSCIIPDPGDMTIYLTNNSDSTIARFVADGFNSGFAYPDILLPEKLRPFCLTEGIKKDTTISIYCAMSGTYDRMLQSSQSGVFSIYIFDQGVVNEQGWDIILSENNYLIRYDVTADNLNNLKGNLSYPPTAEMSSIHMYPPYNELVRTKKRDNKAL